ncbi:sporulation protein [Candidatus Poribacteria bacterium]|nr:sporulation protein [Candidatus Poribacteria bacterium]
MNVQDMLKDVLAELKALASTETVIGQPIQIDGKTVVPVIRVRVGFGGGGGSGQEPGKGNQGLGGGFGAGVTVEPIAFITSTGDDISVVGVKGKGSPTMEKLLETLPDLIGQVKKQKQEKKEE